LFSRLIRLFFKNPLEKLFSGSLSVFRRKRFRKRESKSHPKIELLEVRLTPTSAPSIDLSSFQPQKREIAFIDSGVSAEKAFLESINPTIEVVEINALSSGLEQIAKVVANRSGLDAIHVFSHGASGKLFLGNTAYTSDNISNYQNLLRSIGSSLNTDGDILLYGCNIGDSSGLAFVNQFGSFTGADIAVSTNLTGNSKYGGDWVLEIHTGEINTASLKAQSLVGTLSTTPLTSLAENSGANQIVYTAGLVNDTTYSLGGVDSAYFSINASTRAVALIANPDYEAKNSYGFSVIATLVTDSTFTEQFFSLAITDVNEAPTVVALTNTTITLPENTSTSSRIKVADIGITDDALGTNVITLTGTDAVSFEVVGTTLYLKAGVALNYESKTSYAVTVSVLDSGVSGSSPVTVDFSLAITDVNEAPTVVVLTNTTTTLPENTDTTSRIKVADITVTDDALGTNVISLAGTDAGSFEVSGTSLYLKAGIALNFESKNSYDVTVSVLDSGVSGSSPVTVNFSLAITDVNEAPTVVALTNTTTTLPENTDTTSRIKVADITVTDDALGTNAISLTGTDAGSFEVIGTTLYLKAGVALNFESKNFYDVTVSVLDSGVSGSSPVTVNFSLAITDVNEAPVLVISPSQGNLVEAGGIANATPGTPTASMTLTATDPEGQAVNFNITYLTNNGWGSADSGITYSKAGTYGTAVLTIATGDITYTLNNAASVTQSLTNGLIVTDTFTVQAVDDTSISSTINAVFSITGANDSPNLVTALGTGSTSSPDQTKSGAGDWTYIVPANAFADVDSTLSYTATLGNGGALPGWLTFNSTSRTFAGNPPSSMSGTTLVLKVTASDGTSSTYGVFSVAFVNVNDTPTLSAFSALAGAVEDTAFTITYAALLAASNATDVENDVISFRIESVTSGTLTKGGVAVVAGTTMLAVGESLVWTPSAQSNGLLNAFMVKAGDGTTFSATAVQVTALVAPVNDASSFNISATGMTTTWTVRMTNSQIRWLNVASSADGTTLAALSGPDIYTSNDSGVTWNARITYQPSGFSGNSIVLSADGTKMAAWTGRVTDPIYTSTDSGVTWTARNQILSWPSTPYAWSHSGDAMTSLTSSADGTKLAAVVMGGYIYTSNDWGVTWTQRMEDKLRAWKSIAYSGDGTKLYAVSYFYRNNMSLSEPGDEGGMYVSNDSGVTWTLLSGAPRTGAIAVSADGTKLIIGGSWGLKTSNDSGVTWAPSNSLPLGSSPSYYSVASSADGTKLAASGPGYGGGLFTSTDSGVTWTLSASLGATTLGVALSADGAKLIVSAQYGERGGYIYIGTPVLTVAEDSGAYSQNAFLTNISSGPSNESSQTVTFTVTSSNPSLFSVAPAIDSSGTLTFTPAANANGAATITVVANDDGGSSNGGVSSSVAQTFSFVITDANDAPTVTAPASFTVIEDVVSNLLFTGTPFADVDVASGEMTVTLSVSDGVITGNDGTGITVAGTATARTFTTCQLKYLLHYCGKNHLLAD
jgi:VCBS repeat-containing protein